MIPKLFKKFYDKAGLDTPVLYTIFSRILQSAGGIMTLFLITRFLDNNEQGYYYTFSSILSIQIFFELGLTSIITQYIAHEVAHLKWTSSTELEGDGYHMSRLASVIRLGLTWMTVISVTLFFVFLWSGDFFFSRYNNQLNISWQLPWLVLSVASSLMVMINLFLAILEGIGKVKEITKLRLLQQTFQLVFIGIFFMADLRLLANGLAWLLSGVITVIALITSKHFSLIFGLYTAKTQWKINYRKEVLPFQYKIALGSMSGYLIYQLINPVLFATQSATVAGQMGATQAFLNGILAISLSWFSTKVALFSTLVAKRKFSMLNIVYKKNMSISVAVCIMGVLLFIITVLLLKWLFPDIGNRFLTIGPIILLGLAQVASVIGNAQAYYLRSFKKEPFFIPSIVIGLLSGSATLVCGKFYGVQEISMAYFVVNGVIGFVWGCFIFRANANRWTKINRWM